MDTYFAKAERTNEKKLIAEINVINNNSVMSGLLQSVSGLLAILDEHRQIVAVNDSFLKMLGINDPKEALGLRPGEAVQCNHAHEEPAGCGTTKFCSTCGAAIAIVASLSQNIPVERICALTVNRGEQEVDIALLVKSHPIKIDGETFLLLFMQDITLQQQRAALERAFFHDVNNTMTGLLGASEMLTFENSQSNLVKMVNRAALRLKSEIEIQRCLIQSESNTYKPMWHTIDGNQFLEELKLFFTNHPTATDKNLLFQTPSHPVSVKTDMSLLLRILCNMITNALEATDKNGDVKIWLEKDDNFLSFYVWNQEPIPQKVTLRIFQRNFSTKEGDGRGIGTYSMKLFGEKVLGGQVSFTTSSEAGTVFKFSLPIMTIH